MAKQTGRRKPSRKKTLQEVTSTLQDLINNELSDASLRIKSIQSRVEEAKNNKISSRAATPNTANNKQAINLDTSELETDKNEEEHWIKSLGDELEVMLPGQNPDADNNVARKAVKADISEPATQARGGNAGKTGKYNDQLDMWDDDIPVLREVASPPPTGEAASNKQALPPREQARKLAVKIIARLNIELREKGKAELEPLIINRLQRILEEELAQQAANVENSSHE